MTPLSSVPQAEGAMFFKTIEPFVAQASNTSSAAIRRVLSVGAPIPRGNALATVRPAIQSTYAALGIDPVEVGTYGVGNNLDCPKAATSAAGAPVAAAAGSLLMGLLAVLLALVL